jgi:hypothetical protein
MQQALTLGLAIFTLLVAAVPQVSAAESALQDGGALQALITTSELVVGQNRFAFGLLKNSLLLNAATVVVRVYVLQGSQGQLYAETSAPYHKLEVIEQGHHVHVHPDGTRHVHHGKTDLQGIYVAQLIFPHPGTWGLEVLARQGQETAEVSRFTVQVLDAPLTPAPGTSAPRSHNLIASDVTDLRQIDTSEPPDPRLHQVRIADAIAQGKPQVIVFATPRFCTSRVCGPVLDVVRMLLPRYGDRVVLNQKNQLQKADNPHPIPIVTEWNLYSEPWIFVVDGKGIIRAKFEGLVTVGELEDVLRQVLEQG